jgi:hypothetical protein
MDLGTAQWRLAPLGLLGRLSRIDLRLIEGADPQTVQRAITARLPADAVWTTPEADEQRMSNVSRAYRVNLNVLALVALFTGAFLVFATMALAVVRQQGELALLGVLGATARARLGAVLAQGAILGALGALLGTAGGIGLAVVADAPLHLLHALPPIRQHTQEAGGHDLWSHNLDIRVRRHRITRQMLKHTTRQRRVHYLRLQASKQLALLRRCHQQALCHRHARLTKRLTRFAIRRRNNRQPAQLRIHDTPR